MGFVLQFEPVLLEFAPEMRDAWHAGERFDCANPYCRNLPGAFGSGEYLVGRYWEERGYSWIHHDFNLFGANKPDKYPDSQAILEEAIGAGVCVLSVRCCFGSAHTAEGTGA